MDSWDVKYLLLMDFVNREGHTSVPNEYKTPDGVRLGVWVRTQRLRTGRRQSLERQARLEALPGWTWASLGKFWNDGFLHLKEFSEREGHVLVPQKFSSADGYRLGVWVNFQRMHRDSLAQDRKNLLNSIPGWSWNVISDQWETGFLQLKEFVKNEGHSLVPAHYQNHLGYKLGSWVSMQRTRKYRISLEQQARLEALPGWTWRVIGIDWYVGFQHLKDFVDREGHVKVPYRFKLENGYGLGLWVSAQKYKYRHRLLTLKFSSLLETLPGWVW